MKSICKVPTAGENDTSCSITLNLVGSIPTCAVVRQYYSTFPMWDIITKVDIAGAARAVWTRVTPKQSVIKSAKLTRRTLAN